MFFTCIELKVLTLYSKKSTDTAEQVLNLTIRNIRILALKRVFGLIILILQTCKLRPWKGEALSLVSALIQSAFDLRRPLGSETCNSTSAGRSLEPQAADHGAEPLPSPPPKIAALSYFPGAGKREHALYSKNGPTLRENIIDFKGPWRRSILNVLMWKKRLILHQRAEFKTGGQKKTHPILTQSKETGQCRDRVQDLDSGRTEIES